MIIYIRNGIIYQRIQININKNKRTTIDVQSLVITEMLLWIGCVNISYDILTRYIQ